MAQEVRIAGATYSDVPSISVPDSNNVYHSFVDTSPTTATDSDVASGKIYFKADGSQSTGTASGGGGGAISVVDTTDTAGGIIRTITAVDISDTTATASDVASGKYFYTANGTKTQGTNTGGITPTGTINIATNGTHDVTNYASAAVSVTPNIQSLSITQNGTYTASGGVDGYSPITVAVSGGGGLEIEQGTWTATEDTFKPTISFQSTHSTPPDLVVASKIVDGEYAGYSYETLAFTYIYFPSWTDAWNISASGLRYGLATMRYHASSAESDSGAAYSLQYPISNTGDSGTAYPRYWVSESAIRPSAQSGTYTWKAGTKVKWIAVWRS